MSSLYSWIRVNSTDRFLEKYLKKLLGKTDIEDALKRLDKLTQEEVRMATAQVLKFSQRIDDTVKCVDDKVKDVGDTVRLVLDGASKIISR